MTRRMRVVHLSRGYEDYVIGLASQLAPFVDLHLVLAESDLWLAEHIPAGVNVISSRAPRVSKISNAGHMLALGKTIRQLGPDVIHYQSGVLWEGMFPRWGTRSRTVTTVHDVVHHPHRARLQFTPQVLLDRLATRSDAVIVHGESLRTLAMSRYAKDGATNRPIFIVPHPVIHRYGTGQARPAAGRNILFFGSLDQWKGIEVLIQAMELLTPMLPGVELKIAGGSRDPDYYRSLPYTYSNISWDIRRQSDNDVQRLFSWADIVVLPYIEASQSGVLHLAQSFAVPVVATRVGALPETINEGETGLLVPPSNPAELASAMHTLLTDAALREKVIGNITRRRNTEFSEHSIGTSTELIYRKLTAGSTTTGQTTS